MKTKWIVVASRIEARIFKEKPFRLIKTLENPLGREKNKALMTDKPGWSKAQYSKSAGLHSMTGEKDPHEEAAMQFARTVVHYLELEGQAHDFDKLVIVAEPRMMGRIRSHLSKHLSERVQWTQKDLGHLSDYEVGKTLGLLSDERQSLGSAT